MLKDFLCMFLGPLLFSTCAYAFEPIQLLEPDIVGGKPLMQALKERRSERAFSKRELPLDVLSNLLWAANGMNRSDGRRTSPSAGNSREVDIYVAMASGVYLYRPEQNVLEPVVGQDVRALCARQNFTQDAPVNLIFVADTTRLNRYQGMIDFYSATDTGFVSQNVYLFCASEGLATVVIGSLDREALSAKIGLQAHQKIILTQPVGFRAD
jgi:SagB-type dehydrogenase family enzyme